MVRLMGEGYGDPWGLAVLGWTWSALRSSRVGVIWLPLQSGEGYGHPWGLAVWSPVAPGFWSCFAGEEI